MKKIALVLIVVLALLVSNVFAQEQVETSFLMINLRPDAEHPYVVSGLSDIYAQFEFETKQQVIIEQFEAWEEKSIDVNLTDYMALYGILGFKLEATFEMRTMIFMVFTRPIKKLSE
jgi:hypothetical protein